MNGFQRLAQDIRITATEHPELKHIRNAFERHDWIDVDTTKVTGVCAIGAGLHRHYGDKVYRELTVNSTELNYTFTTAEELYGLSRKQLKRVSDLNDGLKTPLLEIADIIETWSE